MEARTPGEPEEPRTRVFISYSRADAPFVAQLSRSLTDHGYVADFDRSEEDPAGLHLGISAQDEWWQRLEEMIAAAEVVVFVVSPASAASRVCNDELAYAGNLGKRTIPLLRRQIDFDRAPERLRALNVKLSFEDDAPADFARSLVRLCAELDLDVEWHRHGARLGQMAQQWAKDGRTGAQLLRSGAIAAANAWAARRPASAPMPGQLLLEFLEASRAKEEEDQARIAAADLEARVKAAEALFEGGLAQIERAERFNACESFLTAAQLAPRDAVPERFVVSPGHEGWARRAWAAAAVTAVDLPERLAAYRLGRHGSLDPSVAWFDQGRHLLLAGHNSVDLLCLEGPRTRLVFSRELPSKLVVASGARRAARVALLLADGTLLYIDLAEGVERRAQLGLTLDNSDPTKAKAFATLAVSDDGRALVTARALQEGEGTLVEVRGWGSFSGPPQFGSTLKGRSPDWAGFTPDSERVGVHINRELYIFDRHGNTVAQHSGIGGGHFVAAPDLAACAGSQYDLGQLWHFDPPKATAADGGEVKSTDAVVLQGAQGHIAALAFNCDGKRLLMQAAGGLLEWRRPEVLKRDINMFGMLVLERFGVANRIGPWNRHDGVGRMEAIATHPTHPDLVLVKTWDNVEIWRLRDSRRPADGPNPVPPCACVVVDPGTGCVAAATERGVWTRGRLADFGDPGRTVGPPTLVWDVALAPDRVAATCQDGAVRIWRLADGHLLNEIWMEAGAMAVAFGLQGRCLHIGLNNGVLWDWTPEGGQRRIGALGVGPIHRRRVSADGTLGIAAGRWPSADDRRRGGVALWNVARRRLLWSTGMGLYGVYDADISRDGKVLLIATVLDAVAIDAATGAVLSRMKPPPTDPSKPEHVTAACFGPDDRTAILGLWDGSILHADILSERVLSQVKGDQKVIGSVACDHASGLVASSCGDHFSRPLLVWRGWDADFFGQPASAARIREVTERFKQRHGALGSRRPGQGIGLPLQLKPAVPTDPLAEARALRDDDEMRAADLFVQAAAGGRLHEMAAEEVRLAGQVLLVDDAPGGLALLDRAARGGSVEAVFRIGAHHLGTRPGHAQWAAALRFFEMAGEHGHAHAAYLVAYYNDHVLRGQVGAVDWRAIAAPTFDSECVPGEAERTAHLWYERAAAGGSKAAAQRLAALGRPPQDARP